MCTDMKMCAQDVHDRPLATWFDGYDEVGFGPVLVGATPAPVLWRWCSLYQFYPISNKDELPTTESVVFVVSGLFMCLKDWTWIIFEEMMKLNSWTCFLMYFRKARLNHCPISMIEKIGTPARYMAIAAPDWIKCVPTSKWWMPSFVSPIATMPSLSRFETISDVLLIVLFLCRARETGESLLVPLYVRIRLTIKAQSLNGHMTGSDVLHWARLHVTAVILSITE